MTAIYTLEQVKRSHRQAVIRRVENYATAAKVLDIDITTLWRQRQRDGDGDSPIGSGTLIRTEGGDHVVIGGDHQMQHVERVYILAVLASFNVTKAAQVLGIERSTLLVKRRAYGLVARRYRKAVAG